MENIKGLGESKDIPPPPPPGSEAAALQELVNREMEKVKELIDVELDKETKETVKKGTEQLLEVGEPFNPEEENNKKQGNYQRIMPQTIYTAIILEYMCEADWRLGIKDMMRCAFLPFLLTIFAQLTYAQRLRVGTNEVMGDLADDCYGTDFFLRCIATYTFVGLTFGHVMQVVDMHLWLSMFGPAQVEEWEDEYGKIQTGKRHKRMELQRHTVKLAEEETEKEYEPSPIQRTLSRARSSQNFATARTSTRSSRAGLKSDRASSPTKEVIDDSDRSVGHLVVRPAKGSTLTNLERTLMYVLVIIPCLLATLFVGWCGSGALLRASNDVDLVLNSVAATFVVDLDSYAYLLLIPPTIRNKSDNIPPLNLAKGEGKRFGLRKHVIKYYSWYMSLVIIFFSIVVYHVWCSPMLNSFPHLYNDTTGEYLGYMYGVEARANE